MQLTSDSALAGLLSQTQTIALLGISLKPARPSYRVFHFLCDAGFDVIPVSPGLAGQELAGRAIVASLADAAAHAPIDMVDVFRNSQFLPEVVNQALAVGAKSLWTQLGVVHDEAIATALANDLDIVVDRCPAIEIPRLEAAGYRTRPDDKG